MKSSTKFPTLHFLFIDVLITLASFLIVFLLLISNKSINYIELILFIVCRTLFYLVFQIQKPVALYSNFSDFKKLFFSVFMGSSLLCLLTVVNENFAIYNGLSLSFYVIELPFTFLLLALRRFIVNGLSNTPQSSKKKLKNTVVYSVGNSGVLLIEAIMNNPKSEINILAIIDDNTRLIGKMIHGKRVVSPQYIKENYLKDALELVIISDSTSQKSKQILETCYQLGLEVLELPPLDHWLNKPFTEQQLKKISIEQLLGRDEIQLSNQKIKNFIQDKTILVTGAAGSIGSELVRQIIQFNPSKILLFDQSETGLYELEYELKKNLATFVCNWEVIVGDIRNVSRLEEVFKRYKPQVVYHSAAYKHVPLMELNPLEAIETNFLGSVQLIQLAIQYAVEEFVFISTDKAVNPTNVMGATKRATEIFIQAMNAQQTTKFVTTRFGNVLGSNGSVIPLFEKQIQSGGPLTITDERITRFFMTIKEASQLVLEASVMGQKSEIFVFDMGESVKIIDLAKKMIYLSGLKEGKDITIEIIGLRPGEKLYEELLTSEETTSKTHHPKILIGKSQSVDSELVLHDVDAMRKIVATNASQEAIRLLKKMVPEYKSNNSTFSALD